MPRPARPFHLAAFSAALALTGVDLLAEPALLAEVRDEFGRALATRGA